MPTAYHFVIGTDHPFAISLTTALQQVYGGDVVRIAKNASELSSLPANQEIAGVYLLSGIFPAASIEHPAAIWHRSVRQLVTVLDFAHRTGARVFWPSSIAVFGTSAPTEHCPIDAPQETTSFFAIAKRAGEQWCRQYHRSTGLMCGVSGFQC